MAREVEEVAHPELVAGSDTTKHSHAGGGTDVKSGTISGQSDVWNVVSFATAFAAVPRVVFSLDGSVTQGIIQCSYYRNVTVNGFEIWYAAKSGESLTIAWIATDAGNP